MPFLFDDRLEITSPGGLLRGVTVDRMREGFSKVRNRALASAFTYMNFIDEYGSGIPRILSECEKEGLLAPQLQDNGDEFRVVFPRKMKNDDELSGITTIGSNHESKNGSIIFPVGFA
ncbi:ATP-binding protein [uncultured Selenomonas sp.]|uniref:ATP-binding protein n=1 Tax=uncultured Selenomonas sp. TaxID=159275 RepID=UPI0025E6ACAE|nr:ATP-binding protein [uncultured Selenomonas sp.]